VTADSDRGWAAYMRGNSGHVVDGGVLEVDAAVPASEPRLLLREPDLLTARLLAAAIDSAFGAGTSTVEDAGAIALKVPAATPAAVWLAAVDTVTVSTPAPNRIVIDSRDGTVVAGGELRVGAAVVSHGGVTLEIGGTPATAPASAGGPEAGLVHAPANALVQDVAAGLHAAGARGPEIAAVFEALRAAGALHATVIVR